jgi:hypothetical protein
MSITSESDRQRAFRRIQIRRGISIGFVALGPLLILAAVAGINSVRLYPIVLIVVAGQSACELLVNSITWSNS